ncbi:MAG: 4-(cytidine 5'-diphospho)-2-C-methyl-D-erythritol kinase [Clostridia bacterium]|nr:4-(cytidine 5'-diphospho)-2-C-methyl-D-erythritol kinase [Clostridia bacterium]
MKEMTMLAKAKINLSLNVLDKRQDGYHNIESLMQTVDFGDEVTIRWNKEPGITLTTNVPGLPVHEENIAYRSAKLMQETFQLSGGFDICLNKKIPVAAGLAGGSTNAAAVMHLINRLCGLHLSFEQLAELGVTLGADVPFCLYGKPALCEGIGEIITPVTGLSDCYIVLVNPGVKVSTKVIYEALDGENPPKGGNTRRLIENLSQGNFTAAMVDMKNVMETVAIDHCPAIASLLHKLKTAGANHAMMSGSGATCFGIFTKKPEALEMENLFGEDLVAITKPSC